MLTRYTAPDDETVLIKRVCCYNPGPSALTVTMYINGSTGASAIRTLALGVGASDDWDCWFVLQPGDTFRIGGAVSGTNLTSAGFGAELEGVAD